MICGSAFIKEIINILISEGFQTPKTSQPVYSFYCALLHLQHSNVEQI